VTVPAPPIVFRAAGYPFPALTGRVVDAADLLSANAEAKLTRRLAAVERRSKHQLVVVTVKSLGGYDIADYGLMLGSRWGIGRRCFNDGVLLIVAPNERKARIEVGKGLETALTDAEAAAIMARDIIPQLRQRNYPQGIAAGSEAIIREITS
jgi:uncharacterized protein